MDLNALNSWLIGILGVIAAAFALAQIQYLQAKRRYEAVLADTAVVEADEVLERRPSPESVQNSAEVEAIVFPAWLREMKSKAALHEVELLTPRERECLRLVDRHLTSKQIARELGMSKTSVDTYVRRAVQRLGARDRVEAAGLLTAHEAAILVGGGSLAQVQAARQAGRRASDTIWAAGSELRGTLYRQTNAQWRAHALEGADNRPDTGEFSDFRRPRPTFISGLGLNVLIAIASALGAGAILAGVHALQAIW